MDMPDKMGPCPVCLGIIKPCRCDMISKDDLRKIAEQLRSYAGKKGKTEWGDGFAAGCESCAQGIEKFLEEK